MNNIISSWGNVDSVSVEIVENLCDNIIPIGNMNSYGDSCLPLKNKVYKIKNNEDNLNPTNTIASLINNDYFLYGVPGKSNVTLGGAIASDVHGKDSYWGGSFACNIEEIQLKIFNDQIITCSRNENSDIFFASIGGYGLSGIISGVKLKKFNKTFTEKYITYTKKGTDIDNLINSFTNNKDEYSVAWIDLLSKNKNWIFEVSKPIFKSKQRNNLINSAPTKEMGFSFPFIGNNKFNSMKQVNKFYYASQINNKSKAKKIDKVLFPLNFITNTKNISKQRKIIQIQFSIPISKESYIEELLDLLTYQQKPMLCSLKKLGSTDSQTSFSFIQEGWTIAVDFPYFEFYEKGIRNFYKKLIELNGKIYLAKDSTLNEKEFKSMYPNFKEWEKTIKRVDPNGIFQSRMSKRLGLKIA